ncbi:2-dehydropantoate 2-reductase [Fusarium tjaetaba]|uniref:2-dehydropantoate 2-reductase n=1 Tax=Fusarium tjaetaba TaxID=1567544 RepID=A0A8H5VBQ1_9HYPO|nr:2-dehydropantoate 2-reductase [Fusarium tjaetaba]KAF5616473.1 2-dehydropantoate 2-reductase [Fusarium tjaetaba]
MARVLIFGTGNIGILYSYVLWRAGASVVCICRSNYEDAKENGFTIWSTVIGDRTFRPQIVSSIEDAIATSEKPFDYLLVCTKAFPNSNPSPAILVASVVKHSPDVAVVLIQNGIGIEQPYRDLFPNTCIISGVTYSPTTQVSPTGICHTESLRLCIGSFSAQSPLEDDTSIIASLADLLKAGGASVEVHPSIQIERWKKLVANAAWNPICALSQCRDVQFLSTSPVAMDCAQGVMREVVAVGNAVLGPGSLDEAVIEHQLKRTAARKWPGVEPSMMADILSGKQAEVAVIVGEVVELARKRGVSAPRLETLYSLIAALNWHRQKGQ